MVRIVSVPRVVRSAEEWPETVGHRVIIQEEGGALGGDERRGLRREVTSRVIREDWSERPPFTPSGLGEVDGKCQDILLVWWPA